MIKKRFICISYTVTTDNGKSIKVTINTIHVDK